MAPSASSLKGVEETVREVMPGDADVWSRSLVVKTTRRPTRRTRKGVLLEFKDDAHLVLGGQESRWKCLPAEPHQKEVRSR